ncbi:MAG: transcriptional regulator, PadR family protein [Acidimicrobiaceae bacterium]|nr:transcriptional regulator, PadR family protein [Acidimicrobiaceae bacterium]
MHEWYQRRGEGPRGRSHRGGGHGFGPEGFRGFGPFEAFFGGGAGGGGPFGGRGRARRGDVRAAVLMLLAERPMHGYEIIQELEARTNGLWRPSPGSVYPTLQLLEDEGLVEYEEDRGKRSFSLTETGRQAVAERQGRPAPWEEVTAGADPGPAHLKEAVMQFFGALAQVWRTGTPAQQQEAERIIADARRRIYTLLAEEE